MHVNRRPSGALILPIPYFGIVVSCGLLDDQEVCNQHCWSQAEHQLLSASVGN